MFFIVYNILYTKEETLNEPILNLITIIYRCLIRRSKILTHGSHSSAMLPVRKFL